MRLALLIAVCFIFSCNVYSQSNQKEWRHFIKSSDIHLKNIAEKNTALASIDSIMQKVISSADETFSMNELTTIVNICSKYCNNSTDISMSLTGLLREDHPIYNNKTPIDVNQFRSFLLSSLSNFPPNDELYKYVKSELLFADHSINIAAAAKTARNFPGKSSELIPLMEPFLYSSFPDELVDITTPELNYPIANPTKARYEILATLAVYGIAAYRSINLLDQIAACNNCREYGYDSALVKLSKKTAEHIRQVTPLCCRKDATEETVQHDLLMIDEKNRKTFTEKNIKIIDQEGDSLQFHDLAEKPFVLTFFYTQCTNASKCVSTVHKLGELETACIKNNMADKIGIYGMTYDPDFDSPPILKKYGKMYGVTFNENMKFLKTISCSQMTFLDPLQLRVNYGAGTVNQHGIQLFVFDKQGRLAAISDNDNWSVADVKKCLNDLINE
jgi:cytochrome oxidase Cu insertion factor (SCO1/SenC/PrrC family)